MYYPQKIKSSWNALYTIGSYQPLFRFNDAKIQLFFKYKNIFYSELRTKAFGCWTLNPELWLMDLLTHWLSNSVSQWLGDLVSRWLKDAKTQRLKDAKTQSFSATLWLCDSETQQLSVSVTRWLGVLKKLLFSFYRKKRNRKAPAAAKHAKIMILALNKKNSLRSDSFLFLTLQSHNFLTLFSQGGSSRTTNSELWLWTLNSELWLMDSATQCLGDSVTWWLVVLKRSHLFNIF